MKRLISLLAATGATVQGVDIDPNGSTGARWVAQNFHLVAGMD